MGRFFTATVLISLLFLAPLGDTCFRSLRRPTYETYWLGTYYDSRFLSATCFVLRSFRWALKFIKETYESWHAEMEYAKCVSDTYDMNIPFFTPPWSKDGRMIQEDFSPYQGNDDELLHLIEHRIFTELPIMVKNDNPDAFASKNINYTSHKQEIKINSSNIPPPLLPYDFTRDKIYDSSMLSHGSVESMQELIRITRSLFHIFRSLLYEFESLFLKTFGSDIISCTRKYLNNAFWRWVDKAKF